MKNLTKMFAIIAFLSIFASCSNEVVMADHLQYLEEKRDLEFNYFKDVTDGVEVEPRFDMEIHQVYRKKHLSK